MAARSISAPARNVRTTLPKPANDAIHGVGWMASILPPTIPTQISTRATEMPIRTEMSDASSAMPIQIAAVSQVNDIITSKQKRLRYNHPPVDVC
jgi:hypothetical protein